VARSLRVVVAVILVVIAVGIVVSVSLWAAGGEESVRVGFSLRPG